MRIIAIGLFLMLVLGGLGMYLLLNYHSDKPIYRLNEEKAFIRLNRWRSANKLAPFKKSDDLCDVAHIRVQQIETDFSHDKFLNRNYQRSYIMSENIAYGQDSEDELIWQWDRSPKHSQAMRGDWSHACIATAFNTANYQNYAVLIMSSFDKSNHKAL